MILITGFGPFLDVHDNPSGRLAVSLDGRIIAGYPVVGRRLAVSWRRAVGETLAWANALNPILVLGFGVARTRTTVDVETTAYPGGDGSLADADGEVGALTYGIPRNASIDAPRLAAALGGQLSHDAGRYLCNGWLWSVSGALAGREVGFVHIPPEGIDPARVSNALERYLASYLGTTQT
jgi:pyrrolidone-carboxylate peptidase